MLSLVLLWVICGLIGFSFLLIDHNRNFRAALAKASYYDGRRFCTYEEEMKKLNDRYKTTKTTFFKGLVFSMISGPLTILELR